MSHLLQLLQRRHVLDKAYLEGIFSKKLKESDFVKAARTPVVQGCAHMDVRSFRCSHIG